MSKFYEKNESGSSDEIVYTPMKGERYAIEGREFRGGKVETFISPEIFMTEEETLSWCQWLADNCVLPSTLIDVLSDEFCVLQRRI